MMNAQIPETGHPLADTVARFVWLLPLLPLLGFVVNGALALSAAAKGDTAGIAVHGALVARAASLGSAANNPAQSNGNETATSVSGSSLAAGPPSIPTRGLGRDPACKPRLATAAPPPAPIGAGGSM